MVYIHSASEVFQKTVLSIIYDIQGSANSQDESTTRKNPCRAWQLPPKSLIQSYRKWFET